MNFDILTGILLLAFSVFYLAATVQLHEVTGLPMAIGPKVFPFLLGGSMLILSLILLGQGIKSSAEGDKAKVVWTKKEVKDFLVIPGLVLLYALVLENLGYVLSTLFFLLAAMLFMGRRRWWSNLFWAAAFSFGSYYLFTYWLDVQLPKGLLPF